MRVNGILSLLSLCDVCSADCRSDETQRSLSVSTSKECRAHGPPFLTYFYFNLSGNQRV